MTAKQYFEGVRLAERSLYLIRQQQRHTFEMATKLSGPGAEQHIRSPNVHSGVENAGVRLADLENDLQAQADKYISQIGEARQIINQLPQARFREVLTLRYLCGHTWRTISDEMDYADEKSVFRVHGRALQAADAILKTFLTNTT